MRRDSAVITCVGLSHRTAPVEEREKLAFSPQELPASLSRIGGPIGGAVLLSTCNRTELYATVPPSPVAGQQLVETLLSEKAADVDASRFYALRHEDAVRHLFRVSAGIDSMVLGESQILGQVREAMSAATEANTLSGVLSRLFHSAISVGKRARSQTSIGRYSVSVSSAAVALARKGLGDLGGKTVLVISAGSTGKLAAKYLAQSGAARILVANRTYERAAALAAGIGPNAAGVPFRRLGQTLAQSDIVISGTGAERFVLGPAEVRLAMAGRNGSALLLIDIAVPRDIDPAVRQIPGVQLFDIDDIEAVTEDGLRGRQREVRRVEAIVQQETAAFLDWWRSLDVVPVIASLRQRAEAIRRRELERALRHLPDLEGEARQRIESMTSAIVKKMLDRPIARLKDGADTGLYMEALQDLFDVHPDAARPRREP